MKTEKLKEEVKIIEKQRSIVVEEISPSKEKDKKNGSNEISDGIVFQDNLNNGELGPEMVWIPSGKFRMGDIQGAGDKDEFPIHNITIKKRFAMGRYEVTKQEFEKFILAKKYKTDAEKNEGCHIWDGKSRKTKEDSNWRDVGFSQTDNSPVTCISWNDAIAYTKWLSKQTGEKYRLPTEAEWEYAARAKTKTKYWWGNEIDKNNANCNECGSKWGGKKTAPVGSFACNEFKLCDVIGNLWELTCSQYTDKYTGNEKQCLKKIHHNSSKEIILRGGSWGSKPEFVRSANRNSYKPNVSSNTTGFRLVREN